MPRNGSGIQSSPAADYPAVASTLIESTKFNNVIDDINTSISGSVAADGQTTITANIPMNSKKFTGMANGAARTDSPALGQVQDGTLNWVDGGGTADAITATYSPAITTLVDGQICCVRATGANTITAPTFTPNGLTARIIYKLGGQALEVGSIRADQHELILRYDLTNTRWELLNPAVNATTLALATTYAALAGSASQAFAASTMTANSIVRGNASSGTTTSSAVVGVASTSGTAVYGDSDSGTAVYGDSVSGIGVFGVGNSGIGVSGFSVSSYGVKAEGDGISPTTAAFRIVPQDAQPSGPNSIGDIYVTTAGVLKICTVAGSPGTWASVGAQT